MQCVMYLQNSIRCSRCNHLTDACGEKSSGAGERVDGLRGLRAVLRVERESEQFWERGESICASQLHPRQSDLPTAHHSASGTPLLSRVFLSGPPWKFLSVCDNDLKAPGYPAGNHLKRRMQQLGLKFQPAWSLTVSYWGLCLGYSYVGHCTMCTPNIKGSSVWLQSWPGNFNCSIPLKIELLLVRG